MAAIITTSRYSERNLLYLFWAAKMFLFAFFVSTCNWHGNAFCSCRSCVFYLDCWRPSWLLWNKLGCRYHCFCVERRVLVGGIQGLTQTWGKRAKLATSSVLHGQVHLGVIKIGAGWFVCWSFMGVRDSSDNLWSGHSRGYPILINLPPFDCYLVGGPASWGMHGAHDVLEVID